MEQVLSVPPSTMDWLVSHAEPSVRLLAMRDLQRRPAADAERDLLRAEAHTRGPIAEILGAMDPAGFWVEPGPGYFPKYRSTVWSLILLAQLGAPAACDGRVAMACRYVLDHSLTPAGQFTASGAPSGTADCLQGNLCRSLAALGCNDTRLAKAYEYIALARGSDAPLRYYAAGKCGPVFCCGSNNKQPCAWGAVKVMAAFAEWPPERRTALIQGAIDVGIDFLLSVDPSTAAYPCGWGAKPSRSWWQFGFPVFYVTDVLQIAEALVALGCGGDPRLAKLLALIRSKQGSDGRWPLEYSYAGKTWGGFGAKGDPNPWVTLRALRVLQQASAL